MINIIKRLNQNKNFIVRLCNARLSNDCQETKAFYDDSNFSSEEQIRILKILNESPLEELHKFNVTKARLIKIDTWRTKKGPFRLLSDVLEVEGFGIKIFEKLCHSILNDGTHNIENASNNETNSTVNTLTPSEAISKSRKNIVSPSIDRDISDNIKNAVSLHLTPTGLSWCKLQRKCNSIEAWNLYDFVKLPKKLTTCNLLHLAINILHKIPHSDAYVFESAAQLSPQAKQKMMASTSHLQQLELLAMLTALLNTSPKHNVDFCFDKKSELHLMDVPSYNKVYFLRPFLSAKLFGTLVGSEMVSAIATIESLLKIKTPSKQLPCSEVECNMNLRQYYSSQNSVNKHLLGQALLVVVSFMDLCVYNSPISVKAIKSKQRQNL